MVRVVNSLFFLARCSSRSTLFVRCPPSSCFLSLFSLVLLALAFPSRRCSAYHSHSKRSVRRSDLSAGPFWFTDSPPGRWQLERATFAHSALAARLRTKRRNGVSTCMLREYPVCRSREREGGASSEKPRSARKETSEHRDTKNVQNSDSHRRRARGSQF